MYSHTCAHARVHAHIAHVHTNAYMCKHSIHVHTCIHAHSSCAHKCTLVQTDTAHMYTHTHRCTHILKTAYMYTCTQTCTHNSHAHNCTCMQTHTHTVGSAALHFQVSTCCNRQGTFQDFDHFLHHTRTLLPSLSAPQHTHTLCSQDHNPLPRAQRMQ